MWPTTSPRWWRRSTASANCSRDILTVNSTLVAQQQNEEMKSLAIASSAQNEEVKKISAWAAILFAPTLIGTVYGMNFDNMPELHWQYGYPFAIGLMAHGVRWSVPHLQTPQLALTCCLPRRWTAMWLFLRRRLILWAMLAIAVPLLDWLLGKAAAELRARKGDTAVARGLDTAQSGLRMLRGKGR